MRKFSLPDIAVKDVLITILITCVTLGYYLDNFLISSGHLVELDFYDLSDLFHYSKMKILIIAFCSIWYFTSNHWWRHSILIIISIELIKLINTLNTNQSYVDEIEYITSLPITIPIILLMFFISKKLNRYNLAKEIGAKIDIEIDEIFFSIDPYKKEELNNLQMKVSTLKEDKLKRKEPINYLKTLIDLREEFYKL
jgi:hypothetical protein